MASSALRKRRWAIWVGNDVLLTSISTLDPARISFPVSEADYFAANEQVQEILNKPLEQRPEEIELILADGSTFRNKARLLAVDRQAVLLLSAERLMDGWGWTPISNGSRSDALDRRIYREVFPNSAWFKP